MLMIPIWRETYLKILIKVLVHVLLYVEDRVLQERFGACRTNIKREIHVKKINVEKSL